MHHLTPRSFEPSGAAIPSPATKRARVYATNVVVGLDVGPRARPDLNRRILRAAADLVRPDDGTLIVVHAWSTVSESLLGCPIRGMGRARYAALRRWTRAERLRRIKALLADEADGQRVRVIVEHGRPGSVVRRVADRVEADVVVLGAIEPSPFPGIVVSPMAEALAGGRDYTVLLVQSDGEPFSRAGSGR